MNRAQHQKHCKAVLEALPEDPYDSLIVLGMVGAFLFSLTPAEKRDAFIAKWTKHLNPDKDVTNVIS